MKRHLALLLLLGLPIASGLLSARANPAETPPPASPPGTAQVADKLDWLAFDAATALAQKQNKHLIVDIYTTWCGWCKVMERQTYGDPEVAAFLRSNFILAKVNGESSATLHWKGQTLSERQFARAVGVTGYPATYFLKPDAELLGGVPGYIKSPDFLIYARYVSTRWYEKGKIQAYVDSLRNAAQ
jgi:thioredoxin-related protein